MLVSPNGKHRRRIDDDPVEPRCQLFHQVWKFSRLHQLQRILRRSSGRQDPETETLETVDVPLPWFRHATIR